MANKGREMKKTKKVAKPAVKSVKRTKVKAVKAKVVKTPKREKKPTDMEILQRLQKWIPKIVGNTVNRYKNNGLSVIFNEADMTALAEDTALEVLRRVKIGLKNSNHEDCVDLRGCESYFKRAFINQCLKMYERHAKTDIRAGVQTVGSEEALAVAASKNLYSPEDNYLVQDQMNKIFDLLKKSDRDHNESVKDFYSKLNKTPENTDLQHFEAIVQMFLDGYTAEETCSKLGISNSDFLRQKRLAFEHVKDNAPNSYDDLLEHFESVEDLRVHTRDVNKRQKFQQEIKEFKPKVWFYVGSKIEKDTFVATLYARIDMHDRFDNKSNKVSSKLLAIETLKSGPTEVEMKSAKDVLWAKSKTPKVLEFVDIESKTYLNEIKNKIVS